MYLGHLVFMGYTKCTVENTECLFVFVCRLPKLVGTKKTIGKWQNGAVCEMCTWVFIGIEGGPQFLSVFNGIKMRQSTNKCSEWELEIQWYSGFSILEKNI